MLRASAGSIVGPIANSTPKPAANSWPIEAPAITPDATVYLDANNNGRLDAGELSTVTGVDGSFEGPLPRVPANVRDRWLAAMRPVEGIGYVSRAKPGSILFQNGQQDPYVPADKAALLHRTAGASHTVQWYDSGHGLPAQARIDRWQFLAERIGTAAPTNEERTAAANAPPPQQPQMAPHRRGQD